MAVIVVDHTIEGNSTFEKLGLWLIPVRITGQNRTLTLDLLFDTGAQRSLLTPDIANVLGLGLPLGEIRGVGTAGSLRYRQGTMEKFEVGSILLGTDVKVLIGKLPPCYDNYQIMGLLGADLLKVLSIELDYPEKRLVIKKRFVSR